MAWWPKELVHIATTFVNNLQHPAIIWNTRYSTDSAKRISILVMQRISDACLLGWILIIASSICHRTRCNLQAAILQAGMTCASLMWINFHRSRQSWKLHRSSLLKHRTWPTSQRHFFGSVSCDLLAQRVGPHRHNIRQ